MWQRHDSMLQSQNLQTHNTADTLQRTACIYMRHVTQYIATHNTADTLQCTACIYTWHVTHVTHAYIRDMSHMSRMHIYVTTRTIFYIYIYVICVTWLVHMCDVTRLIVWHESSVCVWLYVPYFMYTYITRPVLYVLYSMNISGWLPRLLYISIYVCLYISISTSICIYIYIYIYIYMYIYPYLYLYVYVYIYICIYIYIYIYIYVHM